MQNLNLFQRLAQETPPFWKKVQIGCLILSLIVSYALKLNLIPTLIAAVMAGFFAGIAVIAQCAVQDVSIIQQAETDPASLLTNIPIILGQLNDIKSAVTTPAAVTLQDVLSASDQVAQPTANVVINNNAPVVETPVSDAPTADVQTDPTPEEIEAAKALLAKVPSASPTV